MAVVVDTPWLFLASALMEWVPEVVFPKFQLEEQEPDDEQVAKSDPSR